MSFCPSKGRLVFRKTGLPFEFVELVAEERGARQIVEGRYQRGKILPATAATGDILAQERREIRGADPLQMCLHGHEVDRAPPVVHGVVATFAQRSGGFDEWRIAHRVA